MASRRRRRRKKEEDQLRSEITFLPLLPSLHDVVFFFAYIYIYIYIYRIEIACGIERCRSTIWERCELFRISGTWGLLKISASLWVQALMGDPKMGFDLHEIRTRASETFRPATDVFAQVRKKLQNSVKLHFRDNRVETVAPQTNGMSPATVSDTAWAINLEKQIKIWHENPHWDEKPPQIKVSVPKGSLCNLNVNFEVGLPPDAIYNIVIDPNNKRVFKNIKEVISRRVLLDEGLRQVVEVEQAAIWRFLWFSGTISVHVIVEQNRANHTVIFKQGKTGFMKRFEGCWKLEPLFLDDNLCMPSKPKTLAEYDLCTGGRGRVGSTVSLEQLVQPALIPPPPVSWYLRGITARTTEMLITDLLIEAARIRNGSIDSDNSSSKSHIIDSSAISTITKPAEIIKSRRKHRRKIRR